MKEIKYIGDNADYDKLSFAGGNKNIYGFKNFKTLEKLKTLITEIWHKRKLFVGLKMEYYHFLKKMI